MARPAPLAHPFLLWRGVWFVFIYSAAPEAETSSLPFSVAVVFQKDFIFSAFGSVSFCTNGTCLRAAARFTPGCSSEPLCCFAGCCATTLGDLRASGVPYLAEERCLLKQQSSNPAFIPW